LTLTYLGAGGEAEFEAGYFRASALLCKKKSKKLEKIRRSVKWEGLFFFTYKRKVVGYWDNLIVYQVIWSSKWKVANDGDGCNV